MSKFIMPADVDEVGNYVSPEASVQNIGETIADIRSKNGLPPVRTQPKIQPYAGKPPVNQFLTTTVGTAANEAGKFIGGVGQLATGAFQAATAVPDILGGIMPKNADISQGFGIGQMSPESSRRVEEAKQNIIGGGLKAGNAAFGVVGSPIMGAISTLPQEAQKGLSDFFQFASGKVDEGFSAFGVDPNSDDANNIKQGLLLGLSMYGAGKAVKSKEALKSMAPQARQAYNATQKAFRDIENLVKPAAAGVKSGTKNLAKEKLLKGAGFMDDTVLKQVYQKPELLTRVKSRGVAGIQDDVFSRLKEVSSKLETLKASASPIYNNIRNAKTRITVSPNWLQSFAKSNLGVGVKNGKFVFEGAKTKAISPADLSKLNQLNSRFKNIKTPNEFLNARDALYELARPAFGEGKSAMISQFAKQAAENLNRVGKRQIKGLTKADNSWKQASSSIDELKGTFFDRQGQLKSTVSAEDVGQLFRNTEKSKKALAELERVSPGITDDLVVLNVAKQLDAAEGAKVGQYARQATISGIGALSGNPALIAIAAADAFLLNPKNAAAIAAYLGKKAGNGTIKAAKETIKNAK